MQMFGLLSLILAVVIGVWWFTKTPAMAPQTDESTRESYGDMIDAARAIPGAPQE